jgi:hypothetical protein
MRYSHEADGDSGECPLDTLHNGYTTFPKGGFRYSGSPVPNAGENRIEHLPSYRASRSRGGKTTREK